MNLKTNKKIISYGLIILISAVSIELYSHGEDHEDEIEEYLNNKMTSFPNRKPNIGIAKNELYLQECSDCHFSYSRGMLPKRSWQLLMRQNSLADHFEEIIELDENDRVLLEKYLIKGASDTKTALKFKVAKKINRSIKKSETPIRISKIKYIWRQHREIPKKYISKNAKVISLSQCSACHQRIDKGIIDEDEVYIPYEKK